jgi:hypothetical protein
MNLGDEKALLALRLFVEGNSLRSTERITGVDINTLMKLLVRAGETCEKVMGRLIVNIPVKDVQCDEIWAFVQKKEGNKAPFEAHSDGIGDAPDQYRWIPALYQRDYDHTERPMRLRPAHQGLHPGPRRPTPVQPSRRDACGDGPSHGQPRPREDLHVPRRAPESHDQNADAPPYAADEWLLEEVGEPVGCILPHFAYYNFCRIHKTLRVTPAMEAGITSRVWTLADLLA